MKTHAFALPERPQSANSGPEPIGPLGHQHEVLALYLRRELATRTQSRTFLTSLTPDTYTGVLLRRSPGRTALSWSLFRDL
jgi:hypothetical protein